MVEDRHDLVVSEVGLTVDGSGNPAAGEIGEGRGPGVGPAIAPLVIAEGGDRFEVLQSQGDLLELGGVQPWRPRSVDDVRLEDDEQVEVRAGCVESTPS